MRAIKVRLQRLRPAMPAQSGSGTRAVRGPERFGDRIADRVATFGGRWTVIPGFCGALPVWTAVSVLLAIRAEDPFPVIFPGLILSCVASLQAPVIVMSRPRQKEKDRERSQDDCPVTLKAEVENRLLHEKPDHLLIGHSAHLEAMQGMIPDRAEWAERKA